MLTPQQRKETIARMRRVPDALEKAVAGLNDAQLDTPYGEGKWTVRQVVHHLADGHMNAVIRCKTILTENHPTLKVVDQDSWAKLPDALRAPLGPSLAILRPLHQRWCDLLEALPPEAWQRTALHAQRGEMTFEDLFVLYANHGDKHIEHIMGLRAAKGW